MLLELFVWGNYPVGISLIVLFELRERCVHEVTSVYTALYVEILPV